jgi:hypothetical protein
LETTATEITRRGLELGFGVAWEVTHGEMWQFFAYNMAILAFHAGGPKEDMWLLPSTEQYKDAFHTAPDLGQYGLSYARLYRLMRALALRTYEVNTDPFDLVRRFVDSWNQRITSQLSLGPLLTVDESMALWTSKQDKDAATQCEGMPGWISVERKPTNRGRESHTTEDCDTRCITFVEAYKGKHDRMANTKFVDKWGKSPSKCIRCVKSWFGSGRCVIADAGFASIKCDGGLAEHGLYMIGNVKGANIGFPTSRCLTSCM